MLLGERVVLTEVRLEDSELLYQWVNDAVTMRLNAPYSPLALASHKGWFENIGRDPSRVIFAIRKEPKGQVIGTVQLFDIHRVHRTSEMSIRIGADSDRGHGYGTDALRCLIDFAWRDLNLQRIWLRVFATNDRAIKAYNRAGFQIEGTMKRACWIDGRWTDEHVMAILRPGLV